MILQPEAERIYRWADATLAQVGANVLASINRDAAEFELYGYDYAAIAAYETALTNFVNRETDEQSTGNQMISTQAKHTQQEALIAAILQVTRRAHIVFANSEGHLKQFGNNNLTTLNDDELAKTGALVYTSGTRFFSELSPRGLTAQHLATVKSATDAFSRALVNQFIAKTQRNASAFTRIELGNRFYKMLIEACDIGKAIWGPINEALYNDYVLYPASQSNTPPPTPNTTTTTPNTTTTTPDTSTTTTPPPTN